MSNFHGRAAPMIKPVLAILSCSVPSVDASGRHVQTFFSPRSLGRHLRPLDRLDCIRSGKPAAVRGDAAPTHPSVSWHPSATDARDVATSAPLLTLTFEDATPDGATGRHDARIDRTAVPIVPLPGGGRIGVIAGAYRAQPGPVTCVRAADVWDIALPPRASLPLPIDAGDRAAIALVDGRIRINGELDVHPMHLVVFSDAGHDARIDALAPSTLIFLRVQSGESA
ncbi:nuclease PIN [Burkholderia multivorans]|nr:nuclease PIN [Burkholderia multivorans]MBU9491516.1 nuclease PIN [Burkholderia multivorans]MBU9543831.1 nuclease PIN [Burkholderia multivorans]MCO8589246.1 nuclease PIN [Burkholderia multivorans]MCO8610415.1 nuclease PIN [Burkholderia multivorans]